MHEVSQTTRRLERRFERLLKQEEEAWDNWFKGNIYTPTLENTLVKVDTFLEKMEQYYQTIERLSDAFYPITEDGRLLTEMEAKQILAEVIHSLSNLEEGFELEDLIKHVRKAKEHCLSFIEEISYQLGQLAQELPASLPIEKSDFLRLAIRDVCLTDALMQGTKVEDEYAALWETLWPLGDSLARFHQLVEQVKEILHTPKRSSSLVESLNSKLRRVQQVKKQVSQEYLWLLALKHNMEPFKHGKRQDYSPFELLEVDMGTDDWVELLRNYNLN